MLRITGFLVGVPLAALLLAYSITPTTMGVAFGLVWWAAGIIYGFGCGWERVRRWRFERQDVLPVAFLTLLWPLAASASWLVDNAGRLVLRTPQHERFSRQLVVSGFFFLGVFCWNAGTTVILQLKSGGFVAGITFGPLFLVGGWWMLHRLHRNYSQFFQQGFEQVLIRFAGGLGLAVIGAAILAASL